MKKTFFAVVSAAALAFASLPAASFAAGKDFAFEYEIKDEQVTVTGGTGFMDTINIPSEIEGLPVTAVADSAFAGNEDIISCTIPDSVKTVGAKAFSNCPKLGERLTLRSIIRSTIMRILLSCTAENSLRLLYSILQKLSVRVHSSEKQISECYLFPKV